MPNRPAFPAEFRADATATKRDQKLTKLIAVIDARYRATPGTEL